MAELQEVVRRLCSIREVEEELDTWFKHSLQRTHSQKLPHQHRQKGLGPILQRNGSLQWQGHEGGRDFPQSQRCPRTTATQLYRVKKGDPGGEYGSPVCSLCNNQCN